MLIPALSLNKKSNIKYIILTVCLGAANYCFAGEEITCPAMVRIASGLLESDDVPAGYKPVFSNSIERLSGGSVFDGSPELKGAIKSRFTSAKDVRTEWIFDKGTVYDVWVSCDYARGLIRLAKQVSVPVSSCTMTSRKVEPTKALNVKFICK